MMAPDKRQDSTGQSSRPTDGVDLLTDPGVHQLSDPHPGCRQLLGVVRSVGVHVCAVGRPGDVDGGGVLVEVLEDAHGVPGVDTPVDEDHVADAGPEAAVLDVGVDHVVGEHLVGEVLTVGVLTPALEEVQRQRSSVDLTLLDKVLVVKVLSQVSSVLTWLEVWYQPNSVQVCQTHCLLLPPPLQVVLVSSCRKVL